MNDMQDDRVEDPKGVLAQDDHMRDMERLAMEVVTINRPFASVTRVTGRITPHDPAAWAVPNVAVRLEVESPEGARPISRIYTIRRFEPRQGLVEIDFVLHEDDSPAMRWLHGARPGDRVWMTGPRAHFVPPFSPGRRAAIFADDTAIPAVYAILKAWPEGVEGAIWVDACDAAAMDELPAVPGVERYLMLRGQGVPAGTGNRLFEAAQAALRDPAGWTIWAAGERTEMRALRKHFRSLGVAKDDLQMLGYWKEGTSSSELDRMRLAAYETARANGLRMDEMMDSEEAV